MITVPTPVICGDDLLRDADIYVGSIFPTGAAQKDPSITENLMHPVVMPNVDTLKYIFSK